MRNDELKTALNSSFRIHHSSFSSQLFPHGHQLDADSAGGLVCDPRAGLGAAGGVEPDAGERRHQLERAEALRLRFTLARLKDGARHAAPRPARVDEEGADLRGLRPRVEVARVARGETVAAEERPPLTPAAAPDRLAP